MDYLVTGGRGFVGSHLVERLRRDGHEVFVFDKGDSFTDRPYDAVFHLAAQSSQDISFDDPWADKIDNQDITLDMLEHHTDRFIYTSSMAVYGRRARIKPVEDSLCIPTSYYGVHKLASEGYVRLSGMNYTIFRLQTVYGPGQNLANHRQGIISIFLAMMLADEPVVVKGSLLRFRDFIYVDDVVDVLVESLDTEATYCQTYNLGTGEPTTVKEMLAMLAKSVGYEGEIIEEGSTKGDFHGAWGNISKICRDMEWTPKVSLEEGIEKFVEDSRASLQL